MIIHVTTWQGNPVQAHVLSGSASGDTTAAEVPNTGPNPISPEGKELVWGAGSFLVFLVLMRLFLFPKLKKGMDARYNGIQSDLEYADATRISARTEVSQYESAMADIRSQAAIRIDQARQVLDSERTAAIAEVNSRIARQRATAESEASAARLAIQDQIASAVATVAERTTQIAVGKSPDASVVRRAVSQAMAAGVNA
ncbi:MAG: ATP synthase F0 subunit B [Ilumatobacteraceae bacterium]